MQILCCIWHRWSLQPGPDMFRLKPWGIVVIVLCLFSQAQAATYRYAGNNPMAKMMLDLMEVMGFIHRVPDSTGGYGPSTFSGWNPLGMYSGLSNPMLMYQGAGMASQFPTMFPGQSPWGSQPFAQPGNMAAAPGQQRIELSVDELQRLLESRSAPQLPPVHQGALQGPSSPVPANLPETIPRLSERNEVAAGNNSVGQDQFEGVWLGSRNDLLRISGNNFIWTSADGSALDGSFYLEDGVMVVQTRQSEKPARYRVQFSPNRFVAVNEAGYRYEFVRPVSSRQGPAPGYSAGK